MSGPFCGTSAASRSTPRMKPIPIGSPAAADDSCFPGSWCGNRSRTEPRAVSSSNLPVTGPRDSETMRRIESLVAEISSRPGVAPRASEAPEFSPVPIQGERERWMESNRLALDAIEQGTIRKVVLSRDFILTSSSGAIDTPRILKRIEPQLAHGHLFCFRFDPDAAFLGATPERLVSLAGSAIAVRLPRGDRTRRKGRPRGRCGGRSASAEREGLSRAPLRARRNRLLALARGEMDRGRDTPHGLATLGAPPPFHVDPGVLARRRRRRRSPTPSPSDARSGRIAAGPSARPDPATRRPRSRAGTRDR